MLHKGLYDSSPVVRFRRRWFARRPFHEPPVSVSRVSVIGSDCVWCGLLRRNNTVTVTVTVGKHQATKAEARGLRAQPRAALVDANGAGCMHDQILIS